MALRNAFCPNCGQPTQIDDTKEFCFCLSCGNKINIPKRQQPTIESNAGVSEHEPKQRAQSQLEGNANRESPQSRMAPEDKLNEAEFYYKLSIDKKEYSRIDDNPTYYLKGQDLLVDLSQQFPSDYRVWWELCKPMDFAIVLAGDSSENPCSLNGTYFDKALDLAPLDKKMELINQHDKYSEIKGAVLERIQAEKEALEAQERARIEEEQRRIMEEEAERQRQEEIRRKEEQEKLERERIEAEQKAAELAKSQQEMSVNLWMSLKNKDYSYINDTYFQFKSPEGIPIIATLKVMANVLYLSAFHVDANKNNTIYLDQSIAIHFGDNGFAIKFDNRPVTVRGWSPSANTIQVVASPHGGFMVNDLPLISDPGYVANVSRGAKKPIVTFKKVFS